MKIRVLIINALSFQSQQAHRRCCEDLQQLGVREGAHPRQTLRVVLGENTQESTASYLWENRKQEQCWWTGFNLKTKIDAERLRHSFYNSPRHGVHHLWTEPLWDSSPAGQSPKTKGATCPLAVDVIDCVTQWLGCLGPNKRTLPSLSLDWCWLVTYGLLANTVSSVWSASVYTNL